MDRSRRTTACCCVGANPLTHSCVQLHMRYQVLNHVAPGSEWSNYECCQGYIPACPPCFEPGRCGERDCPRSCMFLEAFCFPGLAISASRFVLMEQYHLRPDPCDNRMIRINNCLQLLSIICDIAAHFDRNLRDLAQLIDCAADLIFLAISGCMTAQMDHEMAYRTALEAGRPDTYASVATSEPAGPAGVVEGKIVTPLQVETMDR